MQAPISIKQVHSCIGAVTYYCDMWPWHSHILALLTNISRKGTFKWNTIHQQAFDAMKALLVDNVLLRYLDHNIPFHICTDVSDYQFDSDILQ